MSACEQKEPPAYLQEARQRAGYISRGTAATAIPFSPETIGRHERGDVDLKPEDAVVYADGYSEPGIMRRYCSGCPVGRRIGRSAKDRPLPYAALRTCYLLTKGPGMADTLEQIAFDGTVDAGERETFDRALEYLRQLGESIDDFMLLESAGAVPDESENGPWSN